MTTTEKPTLVQVFDYYKDREYYKIIPGLIFKHEILIRTDRIENEVVLKIETPAHLEKVLINGKEFRLVDVELEKFKMPIFNNANIKR